MRQVHQLLLTLLATSSLVCADLQTAAVYIQPIISASSKGPPAPLAEITYDLAASDGSESSSSAAAEVTSFEAPELPDDAQLVRIGVFDSKTGEWSSSTSVASVENFSKGYSPHFVLSVGGGSSGGKPLGVSCRGVAVDAGVTRDFGPQVIVVVAEPGKQPALNKPVVLNADGRQMQPPEEKTFLQKYWWLIGIALFLAISGGGPEAK